VTLEESNTLKFLFFILSTDINNAQLAAGQSVSSAPVSGHL